jgi:hypothetical protein
LGAAGEMSDINSGKPWSEMAIRDLQDALRRGYEIEDIATFLCRDADEVRAKVAELEPRMTAVSAEIFALERRMPAVDYTYPNGDREAHPIGMDDWPILLRLERARKLTFRDDRIRERFHRMKPDA